MPTSAPTRSSSSAPVSSTCWSSAAASSASGAALDAVTRGLKVGLVEQRDLASGTSSRSLQAGPRRPALPRDVRLRAGQGGAGGARPAADAARARTSSGRCRSSTRSSTRGSGPTSAPASRSTTRMAMTGKYDMGVPKHKHIFRKQLARMAPDIKTDDAARRDPLLRLPGRRRPAGDDHRPHRRQQRRPRRDPHQGHRLPARAATRVVGVRARDLEGAARPRGPRQGRHQRGRGLDRRGPGPDRRRGAARRRRQQGHPPRRAQGPDPLRVRLHHQDREVGALRDPVGPLLDHRHHRHRRGTSTWPTPRPARPTSTTSSATSTRCSRTRSTTATSMGVYAGLRPLLKPIAQARARRGRPPSSPASTRSPTRCRASCWSPAAS